jgi:hypothetical protein
VECPQARQASRQRSELAVAGQCGDLLIQPGPPGRGQHKRPYASSNAAASHRVETLPVQPPIVQIGPRLATAVDDPVPQQQFRQPMPGSHQILSG